MIKLAQPSYEPASPQVLVLISMMTANSHLTYTITLNLVYAMVNHPWEYRLDMSPHSSYMILQTRTFNYEIISIGVVFFQFIFIALPCRDLHVTPYITVTTCFLYISVTSTQISIQLVLLFTLCMLYKFSNIQTYPIT